MQLFEGGGATDLLKEDLLAPRRLEVIHLLVSGLVRDGEPCVTDFSTHRSERPCLTRTLGMNSEHGLYGSEFQD